MRTNPARPGARRLLPSRAASAFLIGCSLLAAHSSSAQGNASPQDVLIASSGRLLPFAAMENKEPARSEAPAFELPEAPSALSALAVTPVSYSSSLAPSLLDEIDAVIADPDDLSSLQTQQDTQRKSGIGPQGDVDANGKPIPVDRHQTQRIGGIIPNYRAVSGGAVAHPPGWKYNFKVATRQSFDYAGFVFLGITSLSAEGLDEHKAFHKGIGGFYTYTWHGLLDKTDGTYLQAWLLPSLLHEDTRYYALGNQYSVKRRIVHVIDRQVIAQTYSGRDTPNIAGFGGKVLTQYISRFYYPANTSSFGTLAEKFSFSVARDIGFTALREFYPDYLGYKARKQQRKAVAQSAVDKAATSAAEQSQGTPAATKR